MEDHVRFHGGMIFAFPIPASNAKQQQEQMLER